jgi:hypothetical protein
VHSHHAQTGLPVVSRQMTRLDGLRLLVDGMGEEKVCVCVDGVLGWCSPKPEENVRMVVGEKAVECDAA